MAIELAGEFLEGHFEWFVEWGGLVLFDGFVGDEEGEHFGFGDGGNAGEFVYGFGVVIAATVAVVCDGEVPVVAHPFDVALDGFAREFEFLGEAKGVGKRLGCDGLVDFEEAFGGVATEVG